MRRLFLLSTLVLTTISMWACSKEQTEAAAPDEVEASQGQPADPSSFPDVVATVNGTELQRAELIARADSVAAQAGGSLDTTTVVFYRDVLEDMIGAELLYQKSRDRELEVDGDKVDAQVEVIRSRFPEPGRFEQALAEEGLTLEILRAQIGRDMSIQNLITSDIATRVTVTDDAMRKFYDENSEQMRQPERLRLSHILKRVAPDVTPEEKQAARNSIEKILEQARSGENFATLSREHSEDPGSAQNGGELIVSRGETVPAFEQAAFALEPEGLSDVVETQFGFHIIKLSEKIEGRLLSFEEVQVRIEQHLKQQALQGEIESAVESMREGAEVQLFI